MAHTYPNVLVHCVFGTKGRRDSIPKELLERLGRYFVGIGKNHDIPVLSVGGTLNHVHLLIALPTRSLSRKRFRYSRPILPAGSASTGSILLGKKAKEHLASVPQIWAQ
jgi:REP element-mobilizing transposase RayT